MQHGLVINSLFQPPIPSCLTCYHSLSRRCFASIQVNETAAAPSCFDLTPINLPNQWDGGFVENNLIHFLSKQDSCTEGRHWTLVLDGNWTEIWKLSLTTFWYRFSQIERLFGHSLPNIEWSNVHWWKYAFSQSTKCNQNISQKATSPSLATGHRRNVDSRVQYYPLNVHC